MTTPDPQRSRTMRAVRSKNTTPELIVRKLLYAMGYRFRLHRKDLPGSPDVVLPGRRAVIFVHGCFWHGHDCKRGARQPKTNADYWVEKIERNRRRDETVVKALEESQWRNCVIWECELREMDRLRSKIERFLRDIKTGDENAG